jgi:outer membrane protein assembly factor BamD
LKFTEIDTRVSIYLCLLLGLILVGCSGSDEVQQISAEKRIERAMTYFNDGDYLKAIEDFRIITLQHQGTSFSDQAQFYMAESYYKREQYILAAYEYELLIRTMPTSSYVSTARFRKAMCYYSLSPGTNLDQDYSKKAIDEFQAFIEYFPTDTLVGVAENSIRELHQKMAKKEYDTGILYMQMEYYRAAGVSFDYVIEKYHDTPYAEPAGFKKGETLFLRKKYIDAKNAFTKFLAKYPNSKLKPDVEEILAESEKKLKEPSTDQRPAEKK